ncbi:MAG: metallo-hydrolase family protein [Veillonellales bacterium]
MLKRIVALVIVLTVTASSVFAASPLEREINNDIRGFDGRVGIYAKNLRTGKVIDYHKDEIFPTASTSKLVVALAAYKYLYNRADGEKKELYDSDVKYMLTISDNASFDELLSEISLYKPDALKKVAQDLRLKQTQIHSEEAFQRYQYHSVTTPYEMSKVFENIYREKYLDREKSKVLKDELANTIFHDEIPRYMLTPVMHKVGELDDVLCDVGVVDDGRDPILISAYTVTGNSEQYASDFIAGISAKLYNALRRK